MHEVDAEVFSQIVKKHVARLNNGPVEPDTAVAALFPTPEAYRERIAHGGSGFSASPVAADGKLYLPGEDGTIFVIRAGREFELLAENSVPEWVMATPAISGGALYVRAKTHLYAIGR